MKRLILFLFVVVTVFSCKRKTLCNDWFDMNLKNKPKSIVEIETFSLMEMYSKDKEMSLDSSLSIWTAKYGISFNRKGRIIEKTVKERGEKSETTFLYKYHKKNKTKYVIEVSEKSAERALTWEESIVRNPETCATMRIVNYPVIDTTYFERDEDNRVIEKKRYLYGADSKSVIKHFYKLNTNGDKVIEIVSRKFEFEDGMVSESIDTLNYDYIYDFANNWIVRIQKEMDKIILITQRTIEY